MILTNNAHDIAVSVDNTKIYIADGDSGIKIFNLSIMQNPTLIKSITNINAQKILLSKDGSQIYAIDGADGLKIIDVKAVHPLHKLSVVLIYTLFMTLYSIRTTTAFC